MVDATTKSRINKQVEAFKSGFYQVFRIRHLKVFTEEELEQLMCGDHVQWSSDELVVHVKFDHGYTISSPPIVNVKGSNESRICNSIGVAITYHGIFCKKKNMRTGFGKKLTLSYGMKPEDVGLTKDLQFLKLKSEVEGTPIVTSSTIYKCENFELCLFFLPPNAVIPLHNHPEMTVFSKLLLGTMHIKAYDWVEE